ncbi:hypothetical protein [uncultured Legionella sp.]|uniref:hypothetical protein n=1 Tax=uncultured Legionella sp. TaxID=210934 RepID=UPI00262988C3|nr:hypothetical protein [uncultured Legionella sp.]
MDGIPLNVCSRMNLRHSSSKNINILCMTGIPLEEPHFSKRKVIFSHQFQEFGNKAIIIKPECIATFLEKIHKALNKKEYYYACPGEPYLHTHVDYEEDSFSGRMGIFRKLKTYEWQHEFRLAIFRDLKRSNPRPIILNIGNIEKLCIIAETSDLIKNGIELTPIPN